MKYYIERDDENGYYALRDDHGGLCQSKSRNALVRIRDAIADQLLIGQTVERLDSRATHYVVVAVTSGPPGLILRDAAGVLRTGLISSDTATYKIVEPELARPANLPSADPAIGLHRALELIMALAGIDKSFAPAEDLQIICERAKQFLADRERVLGEMA